MSTSTSTRTEVPTMTGVTVVDEWQDAIPKQVAYADALPQAQANKIWVQMYAKARVSNEKQQRELRMAVYVHGLLNGTSREGDYKGDMVLASGIVVPVAIIPGVVGKMNLRKFYRANMTESYVALKSVDMQLTYPRVVARASEHGIDAQEAFATADWLTDCPEFTPSEARAHNASFRHAIQRAKRAREGATLESVEKGRLAEELEAQGPSVVDAGRPIGL